MNCAIPNCPALAAPGWENCTVHAKFRLWTDSTAMLTCACCLKKILKGQWWTHRAEGPCHGRAACSVGKCRLSANKDERHAGA